MPFSTTPGQYDLAKLLRGAQLPALPQSAVKLLELSQNPNNGPADFAAPIEADPGLMTQVLKFVNSSYFGFAREISNVKLAISLVGIRTIKNFALWSAVFSLMPNPKCGPFDLKCLWLDSLRRGLFARAMAKLMGLREAEDAFAAALLQDMAIPMLAKSLPKEYLQILDERQGGKVRLTELEQRYFGWSHGEAAAHMAQQWNLPGGFAELIGSHAEIEKLTAAKAPAAQLSVALSSLLPASNDETWHDRSKFEYFYQELAPKGSIGPEQFLAQIDAEFAEFAPVLKIAVPAKGLADVWREVAAEAVV